MLLLGLTFAFTGPVTTVPWNGHTGAASFTYDDARDSQIPNLLPQLDSLGIKATFEIAAANVGTFTLRLSSWLQVSRNGHELANHTRNHVNVPADPNAASIVSDMADYLRGLDSSIQSVTFAYPNCNVNGETGVSSEDFMARGCGQTTYAWNKQPTDWMNVQGLIVTSSPDNLSTAISMLGTAKSSNSWFITIVHDVIDPPPDQYSITPPPTICRCSARAFPTASGLTRT
jgi:peptidoglycan/xylan/chitin deacetylase (PgdA/CDA1 family)